MSGPRNPTTWQRLLTTLINVTYTGALLAPVGYATYLCVRPIFSAHGTLIGILSVVPFGPLTVPVLSLGRAWNGQWLSLVLLGSALVAGMILSPVVAALTDAITGET